MTRTRRIWLCAASVLALTLPTAPAVSAPAPHRPPHTCGPTPAASHDLARKITRVVRQARRELGLNAVLASATVHGREVVTTAAGESMTGVPATTAMHFRVGGIAIGYLSTVLLQLADEHRVDLDAPVARWLPRLPHGDRITLRMLADSTSGLYDYVPDADFLRALRDDPFRQWTPRELVRISTSRPLWYEPGTNWNYSHANFVLLGAALEKITGTPLDRLLRERVLTPLGLRGTRSSTTPGIPGPVLHAFTDERGRYEESTFWNPSWTIAPGAVMTSTVCDVVRSARAIGSGELISRQALRTLRDPGTVGIGGPTATCPATVCRAQTEEAHFGLGMVVRDGWIFQNPRFSGYGAVMAYLPEEDLAIAVAATDGPSAAAGNTAEPVASRIAALLAPDHPLFG
ncbi:MULTISPECIES: serine hydrolase [unclassified Streptomyces]|uniref:serine hydrolase domain-containing protein n=1 Tax=unclassified Streptomyces TaxID=2593676 RepID=UPI001F0342BF|nr:MULTISPECIES: serine hydrolase domain-containing protein [unclassified Streptomyces]MCH0563501.1 beta-lactamase family protein [Streptomyces sp. MUM 2J]MCH0570197.1 beta-lactamase family protein [Streptomyces sp. MUM 136J]